MATNYEKGRYYEYKSMRWLEKQGYTTFRSAGSHGLWDVIAYNEYNYLLVQVKYECEPTPAEVEQMILEPAPGNTAKVVHIWKKNARGPWQRSVASLRKEAA